MENLQQEQKILIDCTEQINFNPYSVPQAVRFSQLTPFIVNEFDLIIVSSWQRNCKVYKNLDAKKRIHFIDDWGRLPVVAIHKNTIDRDDSEALEIYVLDISMDDYLD